MKKIIGLALISMLAISGCVSSPEPKDPSFKKAFIHDAMKKTAQWQFDNEYVKGRYRKWGEKRFLDWVYGPYINGLVAAGQATGDASFINKAVRYGELTQWAVFQTGWVGNDHATPQSWLELYELKNDPKRIQSTLAALDLYIQENEGADDNLEFKNENRYKWSWCDALYMSPPTFARTAKITGDRKYLEFLHEWWWKASAFYYSPEHQLYFRDETFFTKKAPNGQPLFWCRGNGWVIGGLVRVLQYLGKDDPMRPKYETELKAMLGKLKEIQCEDGLWHGNLLDPMSPNQPDTSGSGFILYGFAYAINEGLLPKAEFMPVVEKAWPVLVSYVREDGKVEGVQPIGDSPKPFEKTFSIPYGSGAFLLAASEIYKMD